MWARASRIGQRIGPRIGFVVAVIIGAVAAPGVAVAGGGCLHGTPPSVGSGTRVDLAGGCFSPTVISVRPGGAVTFVNRDADEHNVVGVGMTWGDPDRILLHGDRQTFRFAEQGVFPFACWIHPGMVGAVVVGPGMGDGTFGGVTEVFASGGDGLAAAAAAVEDSPRPSHTGSTGSGWWIAGVAALIGAAGGLIARERRAGRRSRDPQAAETP
jgi:plastocyanin